MLKILIIEDSEEKRNSITSAIYEYYDKSKIQVDTDEDVMSAKRRLSKTLYDVCILDINLPNRQGEMPKKDAGKLLLEEINEMDDVYNVPKNIIGLTSYSDIYEASTDCFNNHLSNLFFYENASNVWADQILKLLKKLLLNETYKAKHEESVICVVNALDEPELDAVLKLPWKWEKFELERDPTVYYKCYVKSKSGKKHTIYTAASEHMGMPAITALAMKMINCFSPSYIGITGISAGTKGEVNLGDVIVADPTWDWGCGKHAIDEDGQSVFKSGPYQLSLSTSLRNKFRLMQKSPEFKDRVRKGWSNGTPDGEFNIHIGPVASGASVLADEATVEQVKAQHRKMLGIEMEAFGVFSAADNAPVPQPEPFSIKSVCDYADKDKVDDYHTYAAYTSAMTLQQLVEEYL